MAYPKPSVDPGNPREAHGRTPSFANTEEEAEFRDIHDMSAFKKEFERAERVVGPKLSEKLTLRLGRQDREELAKRAKDLGVGPSTLAHMWIK